ncbi:MAG: aldose 1-epimerase, partial [Microbacteriaceae bacterium]|nr:aldose 1-epimerase [Microbacteriaceae bacterium]
EVDGAPVRRFVLRSRTGITASVLEYGAILEKLLVPDVSGTPANVVLGLSDVAEYAADSSYFGAVVGRYANRIEHGRFPLDGDIVQVSLNDPDSSVHGGSSGFNRKVWRGSPFASEDGVGVHLDYVSPDGEEGYPGTLRTRVTYELHSRTPTLSIRYGATTDRPTVVNLTNHSFFNLSGERNPTILDHSIEVDAHHYLPLTAAMLPTGDLAPVAGGPFDLRSPALLAERLLADHAELRATRGFDHNFVLAEPGDRLRRAARLVSIPTGRTMEVWTTEPAIDLYTGNYFDGSVHGVGGSPCGAWGGRDRDRTRARLQLPQPAAVPLHGAPSRRAISIGDRVAVRVPAAAVRPALRTRAVRRPTGMRAPAAGRYGQA